VFAPCPPEINTLRARDTDLTTHERRMATLREQIIELESENIAPKKWVLMGEAGTRQRPQNSLLEEDLEFDRVMKAVPVTTQESVETLEGVIKGRILENRFDDVVRIRPLEDKPFLPSKFFELQDTKSSQSLAEIYENEYMASQSGGGPADDRDGKLQKEHEEINLLWDKICGKLDALCNSHFVPKQVCSIFYLSFQVISSILFAAQSHNIYDHEYRYCRTGVSAADYEIHIHDACSRRSVFRICFSAGSKRAHACRKACPSDERAKSQETPKGRTRKKC